jgi:hypothetical protein
MDATPTHPLEAAATQGLPLFLLWSNNCIELGRGFDSKYITSDLRPWMSTSASEQDETIRIIREKDGGTGSVGEG